MDDFFENLIMSAVLGVIFGAVATLLLLPVALLIGLFVVAVRLAMGA